VSHCQILISVPFDPFLNRYALNLSDTVKITNEKAVCLTEGTKTVDEVMFFFQEDEAPSKKDKGKTAKDVKASPGKASRAQGEPNGKVVGSKVLRAKTRQQFQDPDAAVTTAAKIAEHQKELHAQRQEDGIARYAGEDTEAGEERGKGWKRFLSYKGETALPKEVENMRVSGAPAHPFGLLIPPPRFTSIEKIKRLYSRSMVSQSPSTSTPSRMSANQMRASIHIFASISRLRDSWLGRRRTLYVPSFRNRLLDSSSLTIAVRRSGCDFYTHCFLPKLRRAPI
jgi:hypothetical protein